MTEDAAIAWLTAANSNTAQRVLAYASEIFVRHLAGEPLATTTPEEITALARKSIRAAVMFAILIP